ncbi:MAG TPA: vitamin B12-dependent ribonucleotide reductase [Verrucomicrobiae bacterium]|nr:vitamin B12-dependent ribonucleotide reductase [Verrucomicrobiae bacterium]
MDDPRNDPTPAPETGSAASASSPLEGERATGAGKRAAAPARGRGLRVERRYSRPGVHPFDEVEWEQRTASIANEKGEAVFVQEDIEVPRSWSQLAANVVVSKYFRGLLGTPDRERSARQLIGRVADTIRDWGRQGEYFASDDDLDAFHAELCAILVNQIAAFNSPVWFNLGAEPRPQVSACQPYDALVSTPSGMVAIGELVSGRAVGREVYDAEGVTRIVAVASNGVKPVRRVRLRNGSFVEATPDHMVLAVRDRGTAPAWIPVADLRPGMRLRLHPHRARVAAPALVGVSSGGHGRDIVRWLDTAGEAADSDNRQVSAAAVAGWLQADGVADLCERATDRLLAIDLHVADANEFDWVSRHLDTVLPGVHRSVRAARSSRPAGTVDGSDLWIRLEGEGLREFVEGWDVPRPGSAIRVPHRLWTAPLDQVVAYLRSVFQAHRVIEPGPDCSPEVAINLTLGVGGEAWAEDLQILLASIGIYSRRPNPVDRRSPQHGLRIAIGAERARFAELIGFISDGRQRRLLGSLRLQRATACPDLREEVVTAIDDCGHQPVFDIQTESGTYLSNHVLVHNCFINSVDDTMTSILTLARTEGMLFKYGSGTGSNLSSIRSSEEKLAGGGTASGPVSFMKGFDAFAGVIKSGGTTRRAAKMVILNADHPDIVEFINCKVSEERKAWALIEAGYDGSFTGEAYGSVFFQNSNNSVRVTDDFMRAVLEDREWHTHAVTDPSRIMHTYQARDLMRQISEAAWACGDPGMQFDTTINEWHTSPNSGRINASNPCSEYMYLDDSACNLASLNLMKFYGSDGEFDVEAYRHTIRIMITAMEVLVGYASYPTEMIAENSRRFRPLGLGYANLGALLMARGAPYDSPQGRDYAASVTAILCGEAYAQSARIAKEVGPFEGFAVNRQPMLRVMEKHRAAAYRIPADHLPPNLLGAARTTWDDAHELGAVHGYRNGQATVLAPTGTIGFLMDCDTTGVEPDIALVKYKKLVGGGLLKMVNNTVPLALRRLGYGEQAISDIVAHIDAHDTIEGAPHLRADDLAVFDCAFQPANGSRSIAWQGHVRMMAATQPFLSGAISKTVNLPQDATPDDIEHAYIDAWRMGLKAVAIYRDGSKRSQPLSTSRRQATFNGREGDLAAAADRPARRRLPSERQAITHKFEIQGHEGYITVGLYEDGQPGEIFLKMAKEGSTLSGVMDAFATAVSVALQYGVPLKLFCDKFAHMRFEPSGYTGNREIPIAKSIVDYIFRWLGARFLPQEERAELGVLERVPPAPPSASRETATSVPMGTNSTAAASSATAGPEHVPGKQLVAGQAFWNQEDAPSCADCGALMVRSGACYKCMNCGATSGCS